MYPRADDTQTRIRVRTRPRPISRSYLCETLLTDPKNSGFIAQHLDSFTCKVVKGCAAAGQPFSTTECLRLHQQEVHGIHTGADRPYLCTSKGCGRAIPGNGFANQWVMEEHIRVVHSRGPASPTS